MENMNFLILPRELRDQIYAELFVTDEPLDIMLLIKANGACSGAKTRKPKTIDISMLQTCRQIRDEAFAMLSQVNAFKIYDDSSKSLSKLFGEPLGFQVLRDKVHIHRERVSDLTSTYAHNIRHLHIDINSATPEQQSSYRLSLRASTALAHEYDSKGYSSFQANLWQHSLTAYMVAAILPPASQLRSITVDIGGFLHSECKHLLLDGIPRLYALGDVSLNILLNGKSDAELTYGRNAIDRRVFEDYLSKACSERITFPKGDRLPPRNATRRRVMA